MAILEIITVGHPTLSRKADAVDRIDGGLVELADSMVETMHRAPGIGLAAPQVNESRRLITVDLSVGDNAEELIVLFNPEIVKQEGHAVSEEGCLSVPNIREKVARPFRVTVRGISLEGDEVEVEAEDLLARVLCHEIDHLEGRLFIDRLSSLKRALVRKKLRKAAEAGS